MAYFSASTDDEETNRKFAESLSLDYPILSDSDKKIAKAYGVLWRGLGIASRWTFYIGADGKILFIDKSVKPATAGHDLAARLQALGIPKRN